MNELEYNLWSNRAINFKYFSVVQDRFEITSVIIPIVRHRVLIPTDYVKLLIARSVVTVLFSIQLTSRI